MLIKTVDAHYDSRHQIQCIYISCSLLNIARGTCNLMVFNEKLSGTANGANTVFALANTPFSTSEVSVYVNGMLQTPPDIHTFQDYSVTGSSVIFTSASIPPEGSIILAIYNKTI